MTSICVRNLFRRRTRTTLCVLGVALGVTLIIAIGATTTTYVNALKEMNQFYPGSVVIVPRGAIFIQAISIGGFLYEGVLKDILGVEGTGTATPMIFVLGSSRLEGVLQIVPSNISIGLPLGNWSVLTGSISLQPGGRWPSSVSGEREVVIGTNLPQKYNMALGDNIEVNGKELRIVGILDVPSSSSFLRTTLLMPLNTAQELYDYQKLISIVIVQPLKGINEQTLADKIEREVIGVNALTSDERNEVVEPVFRDIQLWTMGISSAVTFLNTVLIVIVTLIGVTERRKELATLDAIGIPKQSIVRMVVTETGVTGLLGSLLGIPLGIAASLLMVYFYTNGPISIILSDMFVIASPALLLQILLSTVALSSLAGIIVALTITRKNIAEIMRFEC
ncbi:MAG: ABC transporter permease [Candidatus Bathyarchaeota archaeon]